MNTALLLFGLRAFDVTNGGKSFAIILGDELFGWRVGRIALLELKLRLALITPLIFEVSHRRALEKAYYKFRLEKNKNHIIKLYWN